MTHLRPLRAGTGPANERRQQLSYIPASVPPGRTSGARCGQCSPFSCQSQPKETDSLELPASSQWAHIDSLNPAGHGWPRSRRLWRRRHRPTTRTTRWIGAGASVDGNICPLMGRVAPRAQRSRAIPLAAWIGPPARRNKTIPNQGPIGSRRQPRCRGQPADRCDFPRIVSADASRSWFANASNVRLNGWQRIVNGHQRHLPFGDQSD